MLVTGSLLALLVAVAVWNALVYEPVRGLDAEPYLEYATVLRLTGELPQDGAFYPPPGFFLLAAAATSLGEAVGLDPPERGAQLLNAALVVATGLLVLALARLVLPGRRIAHWAALAFFVCCPVVLKTGAMFHPQTLVLFLAAVAYVAVAWMLARRRYGWPGWVALVVALGAAQLVRSAALWVAAAVGLALLLALATQPEHRRRLALALGAATAAALLVALPWYVHLSRSTGSAVFGREFTSTPLSERWPAAFYVSPALPELITAPHREALPPRFWPLLYADTWGDYFGSWSWGGPHEQTAVQAEPRLRVQSVAGLLPTALGVAGWLALVAGWGGRWRRSPERALVAVVPAVALAAVLFYAVRAPSPDGDTVKALFLLPAAPAWAVSFGFAASVLLARSRRVATPVLAAAAVCGAVALVYGTYASVS